MNTRTHARTHTQTDRRVSEEYFNKCHLTKQVLDAAWWKLLLLDDNKSLSSTKSTVITAGRFGLQVAIKCSLLQAYSYHCSYIWITCSYQMLITSSLQLISLLIDLDQKFLSNVHFFKPTVAHWFGLQVPIKCSITHYKTTQSTNTRLNTTQSTDIRLNITHSINTRLNTTQSTNTKLSTTQSTLTRLNTSQSTDIRQHNSVYHYKTKHKSIYWYKTT